MAFIAFIFLWICLLTTVSHSNGYYGSKYTQKYGEKYEKSFRERKFPQDFMFGASTAAFQIEGAWKADGKKESVWDHAIHVNPNNGHNDSADVACNSYYEYERDIQMAKELGLSFYRFSISWPRVLNMYTVNQAGIQYYNKLIDGLLEIGIEPIVTMFHFDLPAILQSIGGLANPLFVDYFVYYAKVLLDNFGDRVKLWLTINEISTICGFGYGTSDTVPALNTSLAYIYCTRHALLGHAKVYEMYDRYYRQKQKGMISLAFSFTYCYALKDCKEDREAMDEIMSIQVHQYIHPIFSKEGDWPEEFKKIFMKYSNANNYGRNILPEFTKDEIKLIRGSADFFGLNQYTAMLVSRSNKTEANKGKATDSFTSLTDVLDIQLSADPSWSQSAIEWLYDVPSSIFDTLMLIKEQYNNPLVIVTENGWSNTGGKCDKNRVKYIRGHINAIYDAMRQGCRVGGYAVWSLMDNFEWSSGYSQKFGLYSVNFTDPKRTRTPNLSAQVYTDIIRRRIIDPFFWPNETKCISSQQKNIQ